MAATCKRADRNGRHGLPRDVDDGLRDLTARVVEFDSQVWREKKERGLSLKDPLRDLAVPPELRPFADDLTKMHHLSA